MSRKRKDSDVCTIFVCKFLPIHSELTLADYFRQFGTVASVTHKGNYAFVEFTESRTVVDVLAVTSHHLCGHPIHVNKARETNRRHKRPKELTEPIVLAPIEPVDIGAVLSSKSRVGEQMIAVRDNLRLSRDDIEARQRLIVSLERVLSQKYPGCHMCMFGSSVNGFGMTGCDLDIFMDISSVKDVSNDELLTHIKRARVVLQRDHPDLTHMCVIPASRCPIVRFEYTPMSLECDISMSSRLAMNNTRLLRQYADHEPCVGILVYTLRHWAHERGVTGSSTALSSYALTILVLVYLQKAGVVPTVMELGARVKEEDRRYIDEWDASFDNLEPKPDQTGDPKLCETLLSGFFRYYSDLDLGSVVMVSRSAQIIPLWKYQTKQYPADCSFPPGFKVGLMTVQDPIAFNHNITQNVTQVSLQHLKRELAIARLKINSGSFLRAGEKDWGINLLVSDCVPSDCRDQIDSILPEMVNTICVPFVVRDVTSGHVIGDVRVDWLVRAATFVVDTLRDSLEIECDVTVNSDWSVECRAALSLHEPAVEVIGRALGGDGARYYDRGGEKGEGAVKMTDGLSSPSAAEKTIVNTSDTSVSMRSDDVINGEVGSEATLRVSEPTPGGSEATPGGSEATPGGSGATSGGSEATSEGSEATPGGSEATPGGSGATSEGSEATPGGSEATPGGSEATPGGSEATPESNEATSRISFDYATLRCRCRHRVWQRRNSIRQELIVVEKAKKNLHLEKTVTGKIKEYTHPISHPIEFTCAVKFVIGQSNVSLSLVLEPDAPIRSSPQFSHFSINTFHV